MAKEQFLCVSCGTWHYWNEAHETTYIPALGYRYICENCAENGSYYDKNGALHSKQAGHGFRCGFELECVPYSNADRAAMCSHHYGLLPTRDGSLPIGGVEFKSPIYRNLSGIKSAMRSWEKMADFSNRQCGQHINFSMVNWPIEYYTRIRNNAPGLFNELQCYMEDHPEETRRVCGRNFCHYAGAYGDYERHENWLNLSHADRLEWRLAKIASVNQYFHLVNLMMEICNCLENNFLNHPGDRRKTAVTSAKIVRLFKKYADGKARCQLEKRNSKD